MNIHFAFSKSFSTTFPAKMVPVAKDKYEIPIPPVQVRFNECTGCQVCARVCTKMTWDAIRMLGTETFEQNYGLSID